MSYLYHRKSAVISNDGMYRYMLTREMAGNVRRSVLWVMLNPSTADAQTDDATITRCRIFSESWGYESMHIGNLYAYRATDPKVIKSLPYTLAVGPKNDQWLNGMAANADLIVCAWGSNAKLDRVRAVINLLRTHRSMLYALKINADGNPAHPLYLKSDLKPIVYNYV